MRWQQVSKCINIRYPTVLPCRLYGLLHIILYNFIVLRAWNELTSTMVSRTVNSGDNEWIIMPYYYLDRTISTDHSYSNEMVNPSLPPRYNATGRRAIEYKKLVLYVRDDSKTDSELDYIPEYTKKWTRFSRNRSFVIARITPKFLFQDLHNYLSSNIAVRSLLDFPAFP